MAEDGSELLIQEFRLSPEGHKEPQKRFKQREIKDGKYLP